MVSASGRRQQVAFARRLGVSLRRACKLFGVARSALRYESKLDVKDAPLVELLQELSRPREHVKYGYRRMRRLLADEGQRMSYQKVYRLWKKAGLTVRRRRRRRVFQSTPRPLPASGMNHVWAYDFVFDACANGQKLKCLTVVDEYTRECLAIDVGSSIRSERVIEVLARLVSAHGAPRHLRSDNGPEFVAYAVKDWLREEGIETAHIVPGKPWQNGLNESFNGKLRDECLDIEWFPNRREAVVVIEGWRKHYNDRRPHSSLGYRSPLEFKRLLQTSPEAAALAL